jgi:hypothetical protein
LDIEFKLDLEDKLREVVKDMEKRQLELEKA